LGFVLDNYGRIEESIASIDRAIRLSPNDPSRWNFYLVKGIALGGLGECDKAYQCYQESLRLRPGALWPQLGLVNVHMQKGEAKEAAELCRAIQKQNSDWTIRRMRKSNDHAPAEHIKKFYDEIAAAWQLSKT
jgi:tetratricopeptide (TPR) repeat protein